MYGTAWYAPPIVFARNDGNLTRMEVLLGMGQIDSVVMVLVNGIEIPQAQNGVNMTATGWWQVVTHGDAQRGVRSEFHGRVRESAGRSLRQHGDDERGGAERDQQRAVAADDSGADNGLQLEQFDSSGTSLGESFSNNPAWVLLDVLRRSGWLTTDMDLASFAAAAAYLRGGDRDHGS